MEENSNGSTYGKFVFISNKMKVCLTNSIGPKSLSDVVMNGTASSIFIPIMVYTAVYTCFMLTCIETYACCRLFFIITLHQVHVLYMLIDHVNCDNQTCISLNMLKVIILVILHSRFINLSVIFCTTISFNIYSLLFSEMSIDYFFVHSVVKEL